MADMSFENAYAATPRSLTSLREGGVSPTIAAQHYYLDGLGPLEVRGMPRVGRLLLTHGAGAGQTSLFMQRLRESLALHGVQVWAIDFAYMQRIWHEDRRRPPPRVESLVDELAVWRDALISLAGDAPSPLWLGGKSMGGRVASLLAARDEASGLALFGYPFHPPGKPERTRLAHWPNLTCPTWVLQGTRDPFGGESEVREYALPATVHVHFLDDGDHDWQPRRRAGHDQAALIEEATRIVAVAMQASE
ncbi:dienelactone hydrolase [Chromohalobacter canadensis]|nr:dienelactone hydrolase [Chromohalobacter canadensis]MCT8470902.1 dienelactone hydrolase [Chromohalobacter canadensis]MCT8497847.1 dienelactone hydrolase [Chromohalobacter canadensis]